MMDFRQQPQRLPNMPAGNQLTNNLILPLMSGQDGSEIGPAVKVLRVGCISRYTLANNRSLTDEH
jgi:hypothetical protein